jgi:hypothetical protein
MLSSMSVIVDREVLVRVIFHEFVYKCPSRIINVGPGYVLSALLPPVG